MMRKLVCRVSAVAPGENKGFLVPGIDVPVMVTNIGGTLYATTSMCPHEEVSLLGGRVDGARVVCPGHAYEFDVTTGRCPFDPELELFQYKTTIVDDLLYIELA
jgi:nitrite reductase/ring-hydroxylating ferredoxin subunit